MNTRTPTTPHRSTVREPAGLLRLVLRIDGASTGGTGVVMLAASGLFAGLLGLPTAVSVPCGIALLGGSAALLLIAGYPAVPLGPVWGVLAMNTAGFVGCLLLAMTDLVPLTGLGIAFTYIGATLVGAFGVLEFLGLRRVARARP